VVARHPRFALTGPVVPEHAEQRALNKVLTMEIAPAGHVSREGVCWFSIDMSNSYDEVPGIRQGRGVVAGVPDVLFLHQGRAFWCELKSRDGAVSDPQRSMAASLLLSGCRIGVATSVDDVLIALDAWGVPRKRMFKVAA
jgi:hypothetical protein